MIDTFAIDMAEAIEAENPVVEEIPTTETATDKGSDAEPEKEETPTKEPHTEKKDEKNSFNEVEYITKVSGGLAKSKEELESIFSKAGQYDKLDGEYKSHKESTKDYIKPSSDFIKKLNEIESKGGNRELFLKVNGIDIDKMSDADAIKLQLQWESGLSADKANLKVTRTYKLDAEDKEDEDVQMASIDLELDGKKAKDFLRTTQVKASQVPDPTAEQLKFQEQDKERIGKWSSEVDGIVKSTKEIKIPFTIDTKDGKIEDNFVFALNDKDMEGLKNFLSESLKNPAWSHSAEQVELAKKLVRDIAISSNTEKMFNLFAAKVSSAVDDKWIKRGGTSSSLKDKDTPDGSSADEDSDDALIRQM